MTKAWRIVLWIVLGVLIVGLVLAGVGWLTGASLGRIVELAFGGRAGLQAQLGSAKDLLLRSLDKLLDLVKSVF